MKRNMKFSWKALLLSPLPGPFVYTIAFVILALSRNLILEFLFLFILRSVFSFGTPVYRRGCLVISTVCSDISIWTSL
jgi:hypothetical protein